MTYNTPKIVALATALDAVQEIFTGGKPDPEVLSTNAAYEVDE